VAEAEAEEEEVAEAEEEEVAEAEEEEVAEVTARRWASPRWVA
jgi:hypothetical protein